MSSVTLTTRGAVGRSGIIIVYQQLLHNVSTHGIPGAVVAFTQLVPENSHCDTAFVSSCEHTQSSNVNSSFCDAVYTSRADSSRSILCLTHHIIFTNDLLWF